MSSSSHVAAALQQEEEAGAAMSHVAVILWAIAILLPPSSSPLDINTPCIRPAIDAATTVLLAAVTRAPAALSPSARRQVRVWEGVCGCEVVCARACVIPCLVSLTFSPHNTC